MRPAATAGQARSFGMWAEREVPQDARGEEFWRCAKSVKLECEQEVGDRRAGSLRGGREVFEMSEP